jgi:hypothetical protein
MKTRTLWLTLSLAVFLSWPIPSTAQWVQTSGPEGGFISAITASGTNLFAGTWGGGVFRSTDNGLSWATSSTGLMNTHIRALAVSGTNLLCGIAGHGVFLSADDGTDWTEANSGLTNGNAYTSSGYVHTFAVSGTNLFAGTGSSGVWRRPLSEFIIKVHCDLRPLHAAESFITKTL